MTVQDVRNPIIHKVTVNPGNEERKAKTKLDEILEEKEERAAKRYSAAELEKMALESENEAARLRGEPPKHKYYYGGETVDDEEMKKRDEQRRQMLASAKALIESGLEPAQVGQMLLGLPVTGQPSGPVVAQGMTIKDVKEIIDMTTEKKEASELRALIASLDKKIDDMAKNPPRREEAKPLDPVSFAKQQAEAVSAWNKAINELMPKPSPVTEKGEPLEIVRERNRHEEKMAEVKAEREYKNKLTDIAGDIPERIGRGLGGQIREEGESEVDDGKLESIICQEEGCETRIYITPDTGNSVTCPKCGTIYSRRGIAESKVE